MNLKITTTTDNTYNFKGITEMIERTSKGTGKTWLVLKKEDKDHCKIALDSIETIQYKK